MTGLDYDAVHIGLTEHCDMQCRYCSAKGTNELARLTPRMALRAIDDVADLCIPTVRFTGGEPTLSPDLPQCIEHAYEAHRRTELPWCSDPLRIEVETSLYTVRDSLWVQWTERNVRLITRVYSADPAAHDDVTGVPDSHLSTMANIAQALYRGLDVHVDIVRVYDTQDVEGARAQLRRIGVESVRVAGARPSIHRAPHAEPADSLNRVHVSPSGVVSGVLLDLPLVGNLAVKPLLELGREFRWRAYAQQ